MGIPTPDPRSRIHAPIVVKEATSADGTRLTYYVIGTGPRVWFMPPAMGAPLVCMKYVFERFAAKYTFVTWDQRGFYHSDAPKDPEAMAVPDHLADMLAVMGAERLGTFVLGGWSMAVQLSLEFYDRFPERVRALVLVNGPFERALRHALPFGGDAVALLAIRAGAKASRLLGSVSRRVLGAKGTADKLHRVGLLAKNPEFFSQILADFSTIDWGRYLKMGEKLHGHSAAHVLPKVRVPTLITSGTRDLLTPPSVAQAMHQAIAGSELFLVEGATHYIVAEYPELLNQRIEAFLTRLDAG